MIEIRLHGRGGQGVVTGAELIAIAAFCDGKFSQAFPYFGVERRGAPIEAYARIDNKFINLREQIKEPDVVIIQDASLLGAVDVLKGLKNNGVVLINTGEDLKDVFGSVGKIVDNLPSSPSSPQRSAWKAQEGETRALLIGRKKKKFRVIAIDGTAIALKILGKPIVNTLMALKLAKTSSIITVMSVENALRQKFSGDLLEKNLELARKI